MGVKLTKIKPYLFISPFFLMFAIFGLYPLISGIFMSFQTKGVFVGIANYAKIFTDQRFQASLLNALKYTAGSVFIILPIALLAALILNNPRLGKFTGFSSTIFFLPSVTSVLVAGIVFNFLLKTNNGPINALLMSLGIVEKPIRFLSDPNWAVPSLVFLGAWRYFGINSIYFLSGLQAIPPELKEAARIDGAGPVSGFFKITLPLLRPIATFVVFTAITGSFGMYGEVITLNGSQDVKSSFIFPAILLYNRMFRDGKMNEAAAIGFMIAIILLVLTSIQRYVFKERE